MNIVCCCFFRANVVTVVSEYCYINLFAHLRHRRSVQHNRVKRQSFDQKNYDRMMQILAHKESVTADNCQTFKVLALHAKQFFLLYTEGRR